MVLRGLIKSWTVLEGIWRDEERLGIVICDGFFAEVTQKKRERVEEMIKSR